MGTKRNPGKFDCYEKADPDEPMFILLGRDPMAANTVRQWAAWRHRQECADRGIPWNPEVPVSPKILEALDCADAMDEWYAKSQDRTPRGPLDKLRDEIGRGVSWLSTWNPWR